MRRARAARRGQGEARVELTPRVAVVPSWSAAAQAAAGIGRYAAL
jgi:hypothetical protein